MRKYQNHEIMELPSGKQYNAVKKKIIIRRLSGLQVNTEFIDEKALTSPFLQQTINIYLLKFSIYRYFQNHKHTISIVTLGNNLLLYAHPILNNDINHLSPRSTTLHSSSKLLFSLSICSVTPSISMHHTENHQQSTSQLYYTIFLFTNIFYSSRRRSRKKYIKNE